MTIIFFILVVATVFFWFSAEAVYESHRRTKEHHPMLFKITGMNEQYLDDREKWVRHFRIQTVLAAALGFLAILAIFLSAGVS